MKMRNSRRKEIADDKDKYIEELEKEIKLLSLGREKKYSDGEEELSILISKQEDFLVQQYRDKDDLLNQNQLLNQDVSRLLRTISINHNYINFLANSFWWKITFPMRYIYRKLKVKKTNYPFVKNVSDDVFKIEEKVSAIIFTYNAGEEFLIQLEHLKTQKNILDIEIIVVDRGSQDHTVSYAKEAGPKVIEMKDLNITDSRVYEKILPIVNGEYVVIIDQNKVVDSDYWIYQSIIPIKDNMAVSTVFFKEDVSQIREVTHYPELKSRMVKISGEQVLFFPEDRNAIQYFSPVVLDKSCILVKKRISNMFLI